MLITDLPASSSSAKNFPSWNRHSPLGVATQRFPKASGPTLETWSEGNPSFVVYRPVRPSLNQCNPLRNASQRAPSGPPQIDRTRLPGSTPVRAYAEKRPSRNRFNTPSLLPIQTLPSGSAYNAAIALSDKPFCVE